MDDTYQVYVNRVVRMLLPEAYRSQVQYIQPSPKFHQEASGYQAVPFPGYSVITPPWCEETANEDFYQLLLQFQQQVVRQTEPGLVVPVPPESFHLTLADLIWDSAYRHARNNPEFDQNLRDRIAQSFQKSEPMVSQNSPLYWQVMGVILRTRAIGVCLAPRDESAYERVLHMRRAIYQSPDLMALGIEQQYNFTAHITLGYFGDAASEFDRDRLSDALIALNQYWLETESPQELKVHQAELRKFDDMTRYYREPDWPILKF